MQTGATRSRFRVANWILALVGAFFVALALGADVLRIDLSPGFGVLQMALLTFGISALTLAAFLAVWRRRAPGRSGSLQAGIGVRFALTGLVFVFVAGFADLLQVGTHLQPRFERPFAGPLQLLGLGLGILSIVVGWLLYLTSRGSRQASSLEFLIKDNQTDSAE